MPSTRIYNQSKSIEFGKQVDFTPFKIHFANLQDTIKLYIGDNTFDRHQAGDSDGADVIIKRDGSSQINSDEDNDIDPADRSKRIKVDPE